MIMRDEHDKAVVNRLIVIDQSGCSASNARLSPYLLPLSNLPVNLSICMIFFPFVKHHTSILQQVL